MRKTKTPSIVYGLGEGEAEFQEQLAKSIVDIRTGKNEDKPTITKSILNILNGNNNEISRLAFETDPTQVNNFAGVYHAKLRLVPDSVLKRIAIQDSLVASIVRARQNHLTSFGRPRPDRFSPGFVIKPNTGTLDKLDQEGKDAFAKQVERAIKLLSTCGHTEGVETEHQRTFSEYLGLSARSAVVCGRIATEIVHAQDEGSSEKRFSHFVCTDAGTIYRATTDKTGQESIRKEAYHLLCKLTGEKLVPERWNDNDKYAWVQVIDGTPKQVFTSDEMKVYNFYPVPDVELDGYPVTPIDTVITAITTHINITTHNKLYFQSGRATRGMLILKSDDASPQMIHQIKQQFNASINSSANCLEGSSVIWTKQYGAITIAELENKVKGVDKIDVWTGTNWEKATAYKTGLKSLVTTKTANGFVQKTSPNHKFTIIDENGDFVWRTQDKLKVGDFVAINKRPIEGGEAPLFNGKKITPEFMEVLGWMSGDGCINDSGLTLYYHHEKELDVRERHAKILKDFGVNVRIVDQEISIEEQEKIKARYGFKSCAAVRTSIRCYSVDVGRAIGGLGFNYSDEGKNVPSWIYSINDELRCSYLKGLFSADGNNHKLISPCITIASESMRDSVKLLLAASGIRCTLSEGRTKIKILGPGREIVESKSVLRVKDRKEFFERVGFLQPHKQPRQPKGTNKDWGTSSSIARSVIVRYLKMVKGKTKLPRGGSTHNLGSVRVFTKRQQMDIDAVLRGDNSCSLNRLMNYMKIAQVEIPEWMNDFCFEPIVEIGTVGVKVEMYDMEVSDKNHAFMVNAARSHNSWRMPVFGVPTDGEITWQPIDAGGGRDAEFQYLTDMNAREILTAFMMSPDELPGWSYLSRGTASQALSESNNEYKLEASRDVGIRPLLASFEDFINAELFPLIDADLAKKARVSLMGLDADSPEKEATRLESVGEIYGTMDDILQKVEKTPVGKEWGGEFLLNPAYQAILDKYFLVGDIKEHFFGHKGASKDPQWQFSMNPVWLQVKQMEMQAQAQQQQAQQQAQGPQDGGGGGGQPGGGGGAPDDSSGGGEGPQRENPGDDQTEKQRSESSQQAPQTPAPSANDLGKAVSMAWDLMQKSENNLPPEKRKILDQHKKTVEWFTRGFERDIKDATREILDTARQMSPKAK